MSETAPARGPPSELHARALAMFGEERQLLALAEELSEASAAVSRLLNQKGDYLEVLTEIVDVESIVASLRDLLGHPDTWAKIREEKAAKLARVLERADPRTREAKP